jgi:TolB protein
MRMIFLNLIFYFILTTQAFATITIELNVDKGSLGEGETAAEVPSIAIVPFSGQTPVNVAQIVKENLYRSGRFLPMSFDKLPANPASPGEIDFGTWQSTGVAHLVIGRITGGGGNYNVAFELFELGSNRQMLNLQYQATNKSLRYVAHQISDAIYQAILGERGAFNTRIAYVTSTYRGPKDVIFRLYISDADGANAQKMLESDEPISSPTWSPDGKTLAYVSLENKEAGIYTQDIRTGKRERITAFKGLNSAPAWSPDGTKMALTLSKDGNPEIYVLDLPSRALRRLTHNPAIDTEPTWSPDGQSIAFTSDRGGSPQIYRMSATGGEEKRVSFSGNYNARPRFSPDGKKLAFIHGGNGYRIATMGTEDNQVNILSNTTADKSPNFAPNGSMIIYSSGRSLATVSVDGRVRQKIAVDSGEELRESAWSPFNN